MSPTEEVDAVTALRHAGVRDRAGDRVPEMDSGAKADAAVGYSRTVLWGLPVRSAPRRAMKNCAVRPGLCRQLVVTTPRERVLASLPRDGKFQVNLPRGVRGPPGRCDSTRSPAAYVNVQQGTTRSRKQLRTPIRRGLGAATRRCAWRRGSPAERLGNSRPFDECVRSCDARAPEDGVAPARCIWRATPGARREPASEPQSTCART